MDFNNPILSINPETISRMNGLLPENVPLMRFWQKNAQNNDLSKLAEFEAQRQAAAQMRPYDLEQKRLANQQTLAAIANQQALTQSHNIKNENDLMSLGIRKQNLPQEQIIVFKELLSKASKADLDHAEQVLKTNLTSGDPQKRALAEQMWPHLASVKAEKMKEDAAMERTKEQSRSHIRGAEISAGSHLTGLREQIASQEKIALMRTKSAEAVADILGKARVAAKAAGNDPKKWEAMSTQLYNDWLKVNADPAATDTQKQAIKDAFEFARQMTLQVGSQKPVVDASIAPGVLKDPLQTPMPALPGKPATSASAPSSNKNVTTPAEAKAAGWTLKIDAQGNKAYVGPNNEIIEIK